MLEYLPSIDLFFEPFVLLTTGLSLSSPVVTRPLRLLKAIFSYSYQLAAVVVMLHTIRTKYPRLWYAMKVSGVVFASVAILFAFSLIGGCSRYQQSASDPLNKTELVNISQSGHHEEKLRFREGEKTPVNISQVSTLSKRKSTLLNQGRSHDMVINRTAFGKFVKANYRITYDSPLILTNLVCHSDSVFIREMRSILNGECVESSNIFHIPSCYLSSTKRLINKYGESSFGDFLPSVVSQWQRSQRCISSSELESDILINPFSLLVDVNSLRE